MGVDFKRYICKFERMLFRRTALVATVAAAAVACPAALAAPARHASTPASSLLARMNAVRAAHHLRPLVADPRLDTAARFHSHEMIQTGVFSHGSFRTRLDRFDVHAGIAGENLAWGVGSSGTPDRVVAMWLASPAHRANLLSPSYTRVGIGSLIGRFDGHADAQVVTADFAG
jgi:uncharacterized protein YkwD